MYDKSLATIAQILDSAQELFVNNNYDSLTMSQIAQAANVTKGAIYHHFSSKEELYLRMLENYLEELQELLRDAVETSGSARERLRYLTELYLTRPLLFQRTIQLVRRDNNRFGDEARDKLVTAYQKALPNPVETIIRDGINANEIKDGDPRLYAWQHVAIVEVCLSRYARERFDTPQKMAAYLTDIFFNGVTA